MSSNHGYDVGCVGQLEINLAAVRHNWRALNGVFSGSDCGAVVKANAYGLGYAPVVQALFSEGCRTFFVATYPEALEVKKLLADRAQIFVLQGCPSGSERKFIEAGIIPVMISAEMLARWCDAATTLEAPCAVKVNTGMNRLGLSTAEFSQWIAHPQRWRNAHPRLIMSHMACADTPTHPLNQAQRECFDKMVALARSHYPEVQASLANSAAFFLGEAWHYDVARPGIALYGGCEGVPPEAGIKPVLTLSVPVIQVRSIRQGEWVGYGGTFQAEKSMRIVIVAGGYADGILRTLSNRGVASFGGYRLPMVGRVSMDSCAFDISGIPAEQSPGVGEFIEVFGVNSDLTEQAQSAQTISYEFLTRLGGRFQKRYVERD